MLFEQNMLPCVSFEGKIILDQKHKIARAPGKIHLRKGSLSICGVTAVLCCVFVLCCVVFVVLCCVVLCCLLLCCDVNVLCCVVL